MAMAMAISEHEEDSSDGAYCQLLFVAADNHVGELRDGHVAAERGGGNQVVVQEIIGAEIGIEQGLGHKIGRGWFSELLNQLHFGVGEVFDLLV